MTPGDDASGQFKDATDFMCAECGFIVTTMYNQVAPAEASKAYRLIDHAACEISATDPRLGSGRLQHR